MTRLARFITTLLLALIVPVGGFAQAGPGRTGGYVKLPEAGVEMVKPAGFEMATQFIGFALEAKLSAIAATSIPRSHSEMMAALSDAALAQKGVAVEKREAVKVDGRDAVLIHGKQQAPELEFTKWMLLVGDSDVTKLVTATVPTRFASDLGEPMKASLMSTRLIDMPTPDTLANVGFTLEPSKKLKPRTDTRGLGKALVYKGEGPTESPNTPVFVASPSIRPVAGVDPAQFALDRLADLAKVRGSKVTSKGPIKIDGLEGFEVVAKGEDVDSGAPLVIYEVILFRDDGYYYMLVGIAGKNRASEFLPEFKATARSFKRVR